MIRRAIEEPCWDDGTDVISATPEWIRIRARCDLKTAARVLQFFDEIVEFPNPERLRLERLSAKCWRTRLNTVDAWILTIRLKSLTYGPVIW